MSSSTTDGREARTTPNCRLPVERPQPHVRDFPAVLYGTDHSGKMAFPVDFPYSHHGASTSFVGLHEPLPPVVFLVAAIATTYPRAAASQTFHGNGCQFTFRQFVGSVRKFAPLSFTVWGWIPFTGENSGSDPNRRPFPVQDL